MDEYPIKIIEQCRISPAPNSVPTSSLALTLFDIPWLFIAHRAEPPQTVYFYEFSHSSNSNHDHNNDFSHKIVPSLKASLSLALQKYYPYAGKIVHPPLPEKPHILYTDGDSVPFTVAESSADFHQVASYHVKDVKILHPLVTKLPPKTLSEDGKCTTFPDLFAIQVTLFPKSGFCIGTQSNHAIGDGMSLFNILKSWASFCRTTDIETSLLPCLDRGVSEELQNGLQTIKILKEWSESSPRGPTQQNRPAPPTLDEKVRATFILSKANIKRLKDGILNQFHDLGLLLESTYKISSFVAACAFTWVCLIKSYELRDSGDQDHNVVHLVFLANCRKLLKTPIPETYLGNCIAPSVVSIEKKVLLGQHGIVFAAKGIDAKVKEISESGGPMRAVNRWLSYVKEIIAVGEVVTVAGSPRLTAYNADFGWGRPRLTELVHIESTRAISIMESRDEEGGLEIGVALDKPVMDVFTTLFEQLPACHASKL